MCDGEDKYLKQKCRDARSNVKNTVNVAKGKWIKHLVDDIIDINMNPRRAWENIKKLAKRFTGHYVWINAMKFRNSNRDIAVTDTENANLAAEHFK